MKRTHFTGIKGVGMTALAQVMQDQGWGVQGSDTGEWFITDPVLKRRNIKVFERFTPRNLFRIEKSKKIPVIDLLIYTGAHHGAYNVEVKWAHAHGIRTLNYAGALGEIFRDKLQICVCGVGGKTTTTAMLATILFEAGLDPSWVIGTSEIPSLPAPGHLGKGEWAVLESDEYVADPIVDKTPKFMYLNPSIIICTNIHHDHPDVYPTEEDTIRAYLKFFERLPKDELLLLSSQAKRAVLSSRGHSDGGGDLIQQIATSSQPSVGTPRNDRVVVYDEDQELQHFVKGVIQVPGDYNVKNAVAAVIAAEHIGVPREKALGALKKYTGSKRRFELIAEVNGVKLYDDYAHHPDEISGLLLAAREKFPTDRLRIVFQPHTYSRTKVLLHEFAQSLVDADEVVMFPIFASAREKKDPSVSSQLLANKIQELGGHARSINNPNSLVRYLCHTARKGDTIFTAGAGNLYEIHRDLENCLRRSLSPASSEKN